MKTYLHTQDILQWLASMHRQLSQYYDACQKKNRSSRAGLLLDQASRREQELSDAIKAFEANVPEEILQTYFQYVPEREDDSLAGMNRPVPEQITAAWAAELVDQTSGELERIYSKLAEMSDYEGLQETFDSLAWKIKAQRMSTAESRGHLSDV
jgi:hypothetical protein